MRANPRQSNVKSVYKTHIDVIHFRKTDEKRLHGLDDAEQKLFTEERVQTLKELAAKPDVYERLAAALAPSIYEHEDIKKVRGLLRFCEKPARNLRRLIRRSAPVAWLHRDARRRPNIGAPGAQI